MTMIKKRIKSIVINILNKCTNEQINAHSIPFYGLIQFE